MFFDSIIYLRSFYSQVTLLSINGTRVVYSPTGPLNRDQDDIRLFYDAALKVDTLLVISVLAYMYIGISLINIVIKVSGTY